MSRADQGERIGEVAGITLDKEINVDISAYFPLIMLFYQVCRSFSRILRLHDSKETVKLRFTPKLSGEDKPHALREGMPRIDLILKQFPCQPAVCYRIVHLFGDQLIVFYQTVVWALGKQDRRHIEGIYQYPQTLSVIAKNISCVMLYYIMSA